MSMPLAMKYVNPTLKNDNRYNFWIREIPGYSLTCVETYDLEKQLDLYERLRQADLKGDDNNVYLYGSLVGLIAFLGIFAIA